MGHLATCPGTGTFEVRARLEPLSPTRIRVEFTARADVYGKVEQARQLLSHTLPSGDLGELFERALDALLEKETRRRFGAGRPRKRRPLKEGSRHVPVEVRRAVWERDGAQCTFVDSEGRRCGERRFLTIEHRHPFALGGLPMIDNLCLLCAAHNLASARDVYGEASIEAKIRAKGEPARAAAVEQRPDDVSAPSAPGSLVIISRVVSALCHMGFKRRDVETALKRVAGSEPCLDVEQLLRKCLPLLAA